MSHAVRMYHELILVTLRTCWYESMRGGTFRLWPRNTLPYTGKEHQKILVCRE